MSHTDTTWTTGAKPAFLVGVFLVRSDGPSVMVEGPLRKSNGAKALAAWKARSPEHTYELRQVA